MTLPLRARIAAIWTLVFSVLLAAIGVASYRTFALQLDEDVTTNVIDLADGLHGYLRFNGDVPSLAVDSSDSDAAAFVHEATRYYQIYDTVTGALLIESAALTPLGLRWTPAEVQTLAASANTFDVETDYGPLRFANSTRTTADGRRYLLQVGATLAPTRNALNRYRSMLLWRLPFAVLLAMAVATMLSRFAVAPLTALARAARAVTIDTLATRRLPLRGVADEVDSVAASFNGTLDRLDASLSDMRQFSAAMAHELRTPLTALRGEIEMALRTTGPGAVLADAYASQIEEIDKLTRLIDGMLTLARAESGQIPLTFARVDLAALAATVVEDLMPVADAKPLALRLEPSSAASLDGDEKWLERLLLNLLDNAIKYTPPGGRVDVRVQSAGDCVRVEVKDTGIGLSPIDADRVFERFFRANAAGVTAHSGAGLGLSLVHWIVAQHHGRVHVSSVPGAGSTFTVELPCL